MLIEKISAYVLTLLRLLLGFSWLQEGIFKVQAHFTIQGLVNTIDGGTASPGWYQHFFSTVVSSSVPLFNFLIPAGEIAIGLGLIFGILTRSAILAACFMAINYWLANMIYIYPIQLMGSIILLACYNQATKYRLLSLWRYFKKRKLAS